MSREWRTGLVAAALALFCAVASFNHTKPGPNVWSRIGPAINLADHGTLELKEFGELTHDKRIINEREFSDKAPGSIFIASLIYGLFFKVTGISKSLSADQVRYLVSTLILGLSAVFILEFMSRILKTESIKFPSYFASVAYVLSAPVFAYHIVYFGHALAALFVLIALTFAISEPTNVNGAFFTGLFFGLATVVEYPVLILGIWASLLFLRGGLKNFLVYAFALLFFSVVPIALYNWYCFGAPFSFGYSQVFLPYYRERMARGFFGFTYPSLKNLWLLTFSNARGLFFWGPAFFAGFVGLILGIVRNAARKKLYIWSLLGFLIYLILFSSYHEASGGVAFGPRHLLPALVFLALGWPEFWHGGRAFARTLLVLWIFGAAVSLIFVGAEPLLPAGIKNPAVEFYPLVLKNNWIIDNWGRYIGIGGAWSLVVPLIFFVVAFVGAWRVDADALKQREAATSKSIPLAHAVFALIILLIVLQTVFVRSDKANLHVELADYHFAWKRWSVAESEYTLAAQYRKNPYIYYYLSLARIELGDYDGALKAVEESYKLGPDQYLTFKLRRLENWLKAVQ